MNRLVEDRPLSSAARCTANVVVALVEAAGGRAAWAEQPHELAHRDRPQYLDIAGVELGPDWTRPGGFYRVSIAPTGGVCFNFYRGGHVSEPLREGG